MTEAVAMPSPLRTFTARRTAIVVIMALLLVLAYHLQSSYRDAVDTASANAASMARALESHFQSELTALDALLREVVLDVDSGAAKDRTYPDRMHDRLFAYPAVRYVGLVSAYGILQPGTWPDMGIPPGGIDVRDRAYYARQRSPEQKPGLVIGDPVLGRTTGERTVHLSHPLKPGPNGEFRGLVVLSIDPDLYAKYLESQLQDSDGGSTLIADNGKILARAPAHAEKFAMDVRAGVLFAQWLPKQPIGVADIDAPLTDGKHKLVAYRHMQNYPLVITNSISFDHAIASWQRSAGMEIVLFTFLAIALFAWAWSIDRHEQSESQQRLKLEEAVTTRTHDFLLARDEAQHRAERLQIINRELKRLATVTAHHFQEPLRPLVSYSMLLGRHLSEKDTDAQKQLKYIQEGGIHLKALLRDFQSYVGILTTIPTFAPVHLADVVEQAIAKVKRLHGMLEVTLTASALPHLTTDADILCDALYQVLHNAVIHHGGDDPPQIQVHAQEQADHWIIAIQDNGPGFAAEWNERSFQLFENAELRLAGSTGYGLPFARVAIEALQGRIWVDNPGQPHGKVMVQLPKRVSITEKAL